MPVNQVENPSRFVIQQALGGCQSSWQSHCFFCGNYAKMDVAKIYWHQNAIFNILFQQLQLIHTCFVKFLLFFALSLYHVLQPPVRTPRGLWRYPSMLRTWAWSWGPAPGAWPSSSCFWGLSSSSWRRGERWPRLHVHSRPFQSERCWVSSFPCSPSTEVNLSQSHLSARVYWGKRLAIKVNYSQS